MNVYSTDPQALARQARDSAAAVEPTSSLIEAQNGSLSLQAFAARERYFASLIKDLPLTVNGQLDLTSMVTADQIARAIYVLTYKGSLEPLLPIQALSKEVSENNSKQEERNGLPSSIENNMDRYVSPTTRLEADVLQVIDGANALYARMLLGRGSSIFISPWASFGTNPQTPAMSSLQVSQELRIAEIRPTESFSLQGFIQVNKLQELVRQADGLLDAQEYSQALQKVFSVLPPITKVSLYDLVACARALADCGLEQISFIPRQNILESGYEMQIAMREQSACSEDQIKQFLFSCSESEQKVLALFIAEIKACNSGERNDFVEIAKKLEDFFEAEYERYASFEDIFASMILCRALVNDNAQIDQQQIVQSDGVHFNHERNFRAPYISVKDLTQIAEPELQERILAKVFQWQHLGLVQTRVGALYLARSLAATAGYAIDNSSTYYSHQSGAELSQFVKVTKGVTQRFGDYAVTEYQPHSRAQFLPDADDSEIKRELAVSGNYPMLESEMYAHDITATDVIQWIRTGKARNLVELESFAAKLELMRNSMINVKGDVRDALQVSGSDGLVAMVERTHDSLFPRIAMSMGYQGSINHVGSGLRHIVHQRLQAQRLEAFRHEGESDHAASLRFIKEAVIHVAGTATAIVPSRYNQNTQCILTGPIFGLQDKYMSLVLLRDKIEDSSKPAQIITAIYHEDAASMRKYLVRELKTWAEKNNLSFQVESEAKNSKLKDILLAVNQLVRDAARSEITLYEIFPYTSQVTMNGGETKGYDVTMRRDRGTYSGVAPVRFNAIGTGSFEEEIGSTVDVFFNPALASLLS